MHTKPNPTRCLVLYIGIFLKTVAHFPESVRYTCTSSRGVVEFWTHALLYSTRTLANKNHLLLFWCTQSSNH